MSALLCAAVVVAGQDKPDFSGRWALTGDVVDADVAKAMSVRQSLVRANVRGEPITPYFKDITTSREYETRTGTDTYAIGIIGGLVPGVRPGGTETGEHRLHAVNWDGDTLVFESGTCTREGSRGKRWSERSEVWQLEPDGRLRVTITTRSAVERARTVTVLYQRK
jgi:hypothetical protein